MDTLSAREHDLTVRIAVLEEKVQAAEREKILQAKEYERRLLDLNHAHEKQVKDQSTYISDDKFNGFVGEVNAWRGSVTTAVANLEGKKGGESSLRTTLLTFGMFVLQMIGLLIVAFRK